MYVNFIDDERINLIVFSHSLHLYLLSLFVLFLWYILGSSSLLCSLDGSRQKQGSDVKLIDCGYCLLKQRTDLERGGLFEALTSSILRLAIAIEYSDLWSLLMEVQMAFSRRLWVDTRSTRAWRQYNLAKSIQFEGLRDRICILACDWEYSFSFWSSKNICTTFSIICLVACISMSMVLQTFSSKRECAGCTSPTTAASIEKMIDWTSCSVRTLGKTDIIE